MAYYMLILSGVVFGIAGIALVGIKVRRQLRKQLEPSYDII